MTLSQENPAESPPSTRWAIRTDFGGIIETSCGAYHSKEAALEMLIFHLQTQKADIQDKLTAARRALRYARRPCKGGAE